MASKNKKRKKELKKKKIQILLNRKRYLEENIKLQKKKVIKAKGIRNLKIFGNVLNFFIPITLVSGTVAGIGSLLSCGTPINKDTVKLVKSYSLEIDENDNIYASEKYIEHYWYNDKDSNVNVGKFTIYSPWKQVENGYVRNVRSYSLNDLKDVELYYALLKKDINYISEKYQSSYDEEIRFKNDIGDDDNNDYIIEGSINILDRKDFMSVNESDKKNNIVSLVEIILSVLFGVVVVKARKFDLAESINENVLEYKIEFSCLVSYKDELKEINNKLLLLDRRKNVK